MTAEVPHRFDKISIIFRLVRILFRQVKLCAKKVASRIV